MSNSTQLVVLAIIVVTASILLVVSFNFYRNASNSMLEHDTVLTKLMRDNTGPEFVSYDGNSVDGEFVRSCIEKYGGEYFIKIRTKKNVDSFCILSAPIDNQIIWENSVGGGSTASITDASSKCYVPANEMFETSVLYDGGNVFGVIFNQENMRGEPDDDTHIQKIKASEAFIKSSNLGTAINSVKSGISTIKASNESLENDSNIESSASSRVSIRLYNEAYKDYQNNLRASEDAWKALERSCSNQSNVLSVWGRVLISNNADSDSTESLEYYNNLFNNWVANGGGG